MKIVENICIAFGLTVVLGCDGFSQYKDVQIIEKTFTNCVVKSTSYSGQYIVKTFDGSIYEICIGCGFNCETEIVKKELLFSNFSNDKNDKNDKNQ